MKIKQCILGLAALLLVLSTLTVSVFAEEGQVTGAVSDSAVPTTGVVELELMRTYRDAGYVTAGIGVRNTQRGTISLRIPQGGSVVDAWLYWIVLDSDPPLGAHSIITAGGMQVVGTLIGKGPDPCWGPTAVTTGYTYRANVRRQLYQWTYDLHRGGEFGISIGGVANYNDPGKDPWDAPPTSNWMRPLAEYVGLVVVYRGARVPQGSTVQIFDGYYMQAGGAATFTYNWPARTTGGARFSHLTADGQANASPLTKNVDFAGTIIDQPALNGYDPSIRSKATHSGSLADTDTYNVGSLVPTSANAKTITWNCGSDCISWGALVFWTATDNPWG